MLAEAFEFLEAKFDAAREARRLSLPGDGRTVYVDQGGTLKEITVPAPPRAHEVRSVDDLIAAARKWSRDGVVWICGESITLAIDDTDRRDTVVLPLVHSDAYQALLALVKAPEFSQADLIRLLRIRLLGVLGWSELMTAIRNIRFRQATEGQSVIQHGSESLGRSVEASVTGATGIPEQVIVQLPLFANPGELDNTFTVACDLEIVTSKQLFRFQPLPNELERAQGQALADIRDRISEALPGIGVLFGRL